LAQVNSFVIHHIVAYLLKARAVEPTETAVAKGTALQTRPFLGNSFVTRNTGISVLYALRGDNYAIQQ
jgi:hypothetical protein